MYLAVIIGKKIILKKPAKLAGTRANNSKLSCREPSANANNFLIVEKEECTGKKKSVTKTTKTEI